MPEIDQRLSFGNSLKESRRPVENRDAVHWREGWFVEVPEAGAGALFLPVFDGVGG